MLLVELVVVFFYLDHSLVFEHCPLVQGSGFRVQGSGFRVQGLGFRDRGLGRRGQGQGQGSGFRGPGLGCSVQGLDFGVSGSLGWSIIVPFSMSTAWVSDGKSFNS